MKKIRLTENDIENLVKKIIKEEGDWDWMGKPDDSYINLINRIAASVINIVREDTDPSNTINELLDMFEMVTGADLERDSRLDHTNFGIMLNRGDEKLFEFLDHFTEVVESLGGGFETYRTESGVTKNRVPTK